MVGTAQEVTDSTGQGQARAGEGLGTAGQGMAGVQALFPYPLLPGLWCCRSYPPLSGAVSLLPLRRCCFPPFSFWLALLLPFLLLFLLLLGAGAAPEPRRLIYRFVSFIFTFYFHVCVFFSCHLSFGLCCSVFSSSHVSAFSFVFFVLPSFFFFSFPVSFSIRIFIIMNIFIFLFVCSFIFWKGEGRGGSAISRKVALSGVPLFWSKTAGGDTIAWVVFDFTEPRVMVRTLDGNLSYNTHGELRRGSGSHQVRCRCAGVRAAFLGPLHKFPTLWNSGFICSRFVVSTNLTHSAPQLWYDSAALPDDPEDRRSNECHSYRDWRFPAVGDDGKIDLWNQR